MPGDEEEVWFDGDDEEYDPLEDLEPLTGELPPEERPKPGVMAAPATMPANAEEWAALPWAEAEKGARSGDGWSLTFTRYRTPGDTFAKVELDFAGQPPPAAVLGSLAGAAWKLYDTAVRVRHIRLLYTR